MRRSQKEKQKTPPETLASRLRKERDSTLSNRNHTIFQKAADICINQIKLINQRGGGTCHYSVPQFLPGFPLYDRKECMQFVIDFLHSQGFVVHITDASIYMITIQW